MICNEVLVIARKQPQEARCLLKSVTTAEGDTKSCKATLGTIEH